MTCFRLVFLALLPAFVNAQESIRAPLNGSPLVTAGFGEIRPDHFHSGLDFSTSGKELPVYAVADGHVARLRASAKGYGKAIYLKHKDFASVYAHLSAFAEPLEEFLLKTQYSRRKYELDTLLDKPIFQFKKGDIIGYTGNTGSSTAPHLHFEIRNFKMDKVMNPLKYGAFAADKSAPQIKSIAVFPRDGFGTVNNLNKLISIPLVTDSKSNKKILSPKFPSPVVSGLVGFGFNGGDVIGKPGNLSGIYSIELFVDSELVYHACFDEILFEESRCVNAHIDYASYKTSKTKIQKCVAPANNIAGYYKTLKNNGYYYFDKDKTYSIRYRLKDFAGNTTEFEMKVKGKAYTSSMPKSPAANRVVPGTERVLSLDGFEARFAKGSLFDTALIQLNSTALPGALSPSFAVGNPLIPLNNPVKIRIKIPASEAGSGQLVIVRKSGTKTVSIGGTVKSGWIEAESRELGEFYLKKDTIPPVVTMLKPAARKGQPPYNPVRAGSIRFSISDNLSGLSSINAWLNETWVLMEPVSKGKIYQYRFPKDLPPGTYTFRIEVSDSAGNSKSVTSEFKKVTN